MTPRHKATLLKKTRDSLRSKDVSGAGQRRRERREAELAEEVPAREVRSGRDIPNNYRGVISEVAEAQAQDLGEFGERPVEEWGEAFEWMQEISWDLVKQMVHVKTLRPSGRYAGTFQSKFRKCFNMAIKVYRSAIPGAKLLSKKMIFLLPRMLYFRVENKERINATLIKRADRYLAGDWEALFDEYVRESNQVRRGSAQSTYKAQKRKARELRNGGRAGRYGRSDVGTIEGPRCYVGGGSVPAEVSSGV